MFNRLCTKADPRTGTLRTSWPTLAEQTTLSANHVGKLCRSLREKGYIAFPEHRARRGSLVELAIDKFPLADGSYLMLAIAAERTPAEVPAEGPAELDARESVTTATSPNPRAASHRSRGMAFAARGDAHGPHRRRRTEHPRAGAHHARGRSGSGRRGDRRANGAHAGGPHRRLTASCYQVECVPSGEAALERLTARTFDVVLLDLRMPGRCGLETLKRILEVECT